MSKIQNISESWEGHTYPEVQEFIKSKLGYNPGDTVAVDLGLSSGTKWADRNVGANAPEDFGLYFSWGNVNGHKAFYDSDNDEWKVEDGYIFDGVWDSNKSAWTGGNYSKTQGSALSADIVAGAAAYDAARANLGSPWKMPTNAQVQELIAGTTQSVTTQNGVSGMLFTSKTNSNSVFFPFVGCADGSGVNYVGDGGYFYSVGCGDNSAYYLYVDSGGYVDLDVDHRCYGCPVRAVQ